MSNSHLLLQKPEILSTLNPQTLPNRVFDGQWWHYFATCLVSPLSFENMSFWPGGRGEGLRLQNIQQLIPNSTERTPPGSWQYEDLSKSLVGFSIFRTSELLPYHHHSRLCLLVLYCWPTRCLDAVSEWKPLNLHISCWIFIEIPGFLY